MSSSLSSSVTPTPHDTYFWELVVFQVEDKLFKVPKHAFADNPHPPFNEIFTLPQNESDERRKEGVSSNNPIVLEQIAKADFERFLAVLYPRFRPYQPRKPEVRGFFSALFTDECPPKSEIGNWLSVLKLSSLWNFFDVRQTAIVTLSQFPITCQIDCLSCTENAPFSAVDRIVAGKVYGVLRWFIEGITLISCAFNSDMDRSDAHRVGLDTTMSLYYLKNAVRRSVQPPAKETPFGRRKLPGKVSPQDVRGEELEKDIREVLLNGILIHFNDEISEIISKAKVYQDDSEAVDSWTMDISVDGCKSLCWKFSVDQNFELSIKG
ncbi:hypothetical protein PM082_021988 [Marasmius tenuissimus]|nr:hypothetical protein PM082_021988 [Marasmius tenuissimus]